MHPALICCILGHSEHVETNSGAWTPTDSKNVPYHQTLGSKLDIGAGIFLRGTTKTNRDHRFFLAQTQALQHLRGLLLRQLIHVCVNPSTGNLLRLSIHVDDIIEYREYLLQSGLPFDHL